MTTRTAPVLCQRFDIVGMTCAHCEEAVSTEVGKLDGVVTATTDASIGVVTIEATHEIGRAEVAAAVDEAGYKVAR